MSLILTEITHRYLPGSSVLRDVSISIREGEAVAVMGPSGSGKTTLLSILGLLLKPTRGTVVVDGITPRWRERDLSRIRADQYAWVFQTSNALSRRSARDNVSMGLLAKGATRDQAEVEAQRALISVAMGLLADRPAFRLSGGELQRVCIARAVAARPRYLLADEPTGHMDQRTSQQVLDALWAARGPQTALVIATHDPEAAGRCDRILRLENGRVVE